MAQPKKAEKAKINTKMIMAVVVVVAVALAAILLLMPQGAVRSDDCLKCGNLLQTEASNLKDAIVMIGNGDVNSKTTMHLEDLSCNGGITLEKPAECRNICPNRPNTCWTITAKQSCGSPSAVTQCIDISGSMQISTSLSFPLGGAGVTIEKTGPDTITVTSG